MEQDKDVGKEGQEPETGAIDNKEKLKEKESSNKAVIAKQKERVSTVIFFLDVILL